MKGIVKKLCDIDGIAIDEADAAAQADQMQLFMNVGSVSGIFGNMKKIAEISETAPERTEGEAVPAASEDIVFDRVSFAYTPEQDVLHDVSLRIPAGMATAIIGGNGAGKSTLFKLLTRLYEPKSGAIRFGGDNNRRLRPDRLARPLCLCIPEGSPHRRHGAREYHLRSGPRGQRRGADRRGKEGQLLRLHHGKAGRL